MSRFKSRAPVTMLAVLSLLVTMGLVAGTATPAAAQSTPWLSVSAGTNHTCAIKDHTARTLWCWGHNQYGQLGVGDTLSRSQPAQVSSSRWNMVSAGHFHTCAIRADRERFCWGLNADGQLGLSGGNRLVPIRRLNEGEWRNITAGVAHTCGIKWDNNQAMCWGRNNDGQLGIGSFGGTRNIPTAVQTGSLQPFATMDAGGTHTCGVMTDNRLACWGRGLEGQLGLIVTGNRSVPTVVTDSFLGWVTTRISLGSQHTCGGQINQGLWCWGMNDQGQMGTPHGTMSSWPVNVASGIVQVDSGGFHTCTLTSTGVRSCTGRNVHGQLGLGTSGGHHNTFQSRSAPDEPVWASISSGWSHTCGITVQVRELYCWGNNFNGQVGVPGATMYHVPVQVT